MMKTVINRIIAVSVITAFTLTTLGCATYQMHPEFKERHKNIKSVSLMTPDVEAYILNFQGDKKILPDLIPIMRATTVTELERLMCEKGYDIKKLDLSEETFAKNPELRTTFFHVNEIFKKELTNILKRKKSKFTYSLGSEVNAFANMADCDILIFIKEEGIKKSAGEIAKDVTKGLVISAACLLIGAIYVPIPQTAATVAHVAIVDGNDGDILWYHNNMCNVNWNPENQKQLAALIKSLVSPFPDSAFKPKNVKVKADKQKAATEVITRGSEISPVSVKPVAP